MDQAHFFVRRVWHFDLPASCETDSSCPAAITHTFAMYLPWTWHNASVLLLALSTLPLFSATTNFALELFLSPSSSPRPLSSQHDATPSPPTRPTLEESFCAVQREDVIRGEACRTVDRPGLLQLAASPV